MLVVIRLVDIDVAVDIDHARIAGRDVEFGIADGLAGGVAVAGVVAVLPVVDLGIAGALNVDGVAGADAAVGEDGIGLGIGARLRGRGRDDVDLVEAEYLHEGRHRTVGDRDLDLLVVIARGSHGRHGVAALGVRDHVVDWSCVERGCRIVVGRVLVEGRKCVVERVVEGIVRLAVRVGDGSHQALGTRQRTGVDRVLHQPALEVEAAGVDRQGEHAADGDHGQRHDHDGLPRAVSPKPGHGHQYSDLMEEPALMTKCAPVRLEIMPVIGANR